MTKISFCILERGALRDIPCIWKYSYSRRKNTVKSQCYMLLQMLLEAVLIYTNISQASSYTEARWRKRMQVGVCTC